MRKFRIGLIIIAFALIIGQLIIIDYTNLSWSENAGSYLGIISMLLIIISLIYSKRYDNENRTK